MWFWPVKAERVCEGDGVWLYWVGAKHDSDLCGGPQTGCASRFTGFTVRNSCVHSWFHYSTPLMSCIHSGSVCVCGFFFFLLNLDTAIIPVKWVRRMRLSLAETDIRLIRSDVCGVMSQHGCSWFKFINKCTCIIIFWIDNTQSRVFTRVSWSILTEMSLFLMCKKAKQSMMPGCDTEQYLH